MQEEPKAASVLGRTSNCLPRAEPLPNVVCAPKPTITNEDREKFVADYRQQFETAEIHKLRKICKINNLVSDGHRDLLISRLVFRFEQHLDMKYRVAET